MNRHAALLLCLLSTVCSKANHTPSASGNTGSETHWLTRCESSDDCQNGVCTCGVCALSCTAPSDCAEVEVATGVELSCVAPQSISSCYAPGSASGSCLAVCSSAADCAGLGPDATCQQGVCGTVSASGGSTQQAGEGSAGGAASAGTSPLASAGTAGAAEGAPSANAGVGSVGAGSGGATTEATPSSSGGDANQTGSGGVSGTVGGAGGDANQTGSGGVSGAVGGAGGDANQTGSGGVSGAVGGDGGAPVGNDFSLPDCEVDDPSLSRCSEIGSLCATSDSCCVCAEDENTPGCGQQWVCAIPANNDPEYCPAEPPVEGEACIGPTAGLRICSYCLPEGPFMIFCGRSEVASSEGFWSVYNLYDFCDDL